MRPLITEGAGGRMTSPEYSPDGSQVAVYWSRGEKDAVTGARRGHGPLSRSSGRFPPPADHRGTMDSARLVGRRPVGLCDEPGRRLLVADATGGDCEDRGAGREAAGDARSSRRGLVVR